MSAARRASPKPIRAPERTNATAGARSTASRTCAPTGHDIAVGRRSAGEAVSCASPGLEQLFDTASLLVHQPLPAGRNGDRRQRQRTRISRRCVRSRQDSKSWSCRTSCSRRSVLSPPVSAGVRNPVDLVAAAGADVYRHALEAILGSGEVDALLVIYVSPLVSRPEEIEESVVRAAGSFETIPTAACFLGGDRAPGPLHGGDAASRPVPAFPGISR